MLIDEMGRRWSQNKEHEPQIDNGLVIAEDSEE